MARMSKKEVDDFVSNLIPNSLVSIYYESPSRRDPTSTCTRDTRAYARVVNIDLDKRVLSLSIGRRFHTEVSVSIESIYHISLVDLTDLLLTLANETIDSYFRP